MRNEPLGRLATGQFVLDRPLSHMHQGAREVIDVALRHIGVTNSERDCVIAREVQLEGGLCGMNLCVETDETDRIVYAVRPGRWCFTRFVMNRMPTTTDIMTVVLRPEASARDRYILVTAYWGQYAPPEIRPGDNNDPASGFWANHALIWGLEPACTAPIPEREWRRTPFFSAPLTDR